RQKPLVGFNWISKYSILKLQLKFLCQGLQVLLYRLDQGNAMGPAFGFQFPFGVAWDHYPFLTRYGLGISKPADPVVHMLLEIFCRAESVHAHGTKQRAQPLSRGIGIRL